MLSIYWFFKALSWRVNFWSYCTWKPVYWRRKFPWKAFCRKRFRKQLHELEKSTIFCYFHSSYRVCCRYDRKISGWLNSSEVATIGSISWKISQLPPDLRNFRNILGFPNCFKMVLIYSYSGTRCVMTYWVYICKMKEQRSSIDFWWSPLWNVVPHKWGYKRRFPWIICFLIPILYRVDCQVLNFISNKHYIIWRVLCRRW